MDASFRDLIINAVNNLQILHYAQLSSACIVIFDHLITLDDEISLIWRSSWTPVKVLFLANRYYILAAISLNTYALLGPEKLTNSFCQYFYKWQAWNELVACILADGIFQMRLYAMYSMDKRMLAFMLISFALAMTISGYILNNTISNITPIAIHSPLGGMVCYTYHLVPRFYLFWTPLMAFEVLLCVLAVLRGLQTLNRSCSLGRRLIFILIRDSVLYFFGICATYAACLIFGILTPIALLEVPIVFSIAIPCVLSNRVVLNVRAVRRTLISTTGGDRQPESSMEFESYGKPPLPSTV